MFFSKGFCYWGVQWNVEDHVYKVVESFLSREWSYRRIHTTNECNRWLCLKKGRDEVKLADKCFEIERNFDRKAK